MDPGLLEVVALVGVNEGEEAGTAELGERAANAVEEMGVAEVDIAIEAGGPDLLGNGLG